MKTSFLWNKLITGKLASVKRFECRLFELTGFDASLLFLQRLEGVLVRLRCPMCKILLILELSRFEPVIAEIEERASRALRKPCKTLCTKDCFVVSNRKDRGGNFFFS